MEIWWINFEKKLKFRNLYVHQIVHMMGSKVMKIQMLIHTTQAFWQSDICHFIPFLFFLSLHTFLVCKPTRQECKCIHFSPPHKQLHAPPTSFFLILAPEQY